MESRETLSLDRLPFDCIVTLCEYFSAEDLARFGRVCTVFHEATQVGYLWRRLSLSRWAFCDVHQISEGAQRWRRYFTARRGLEAKMDTGKPLRDYRVRTLRGHEKDIVSVAVLRETGGGDINWENPSHPLVVSLSGDGSVKAWDVTQGKAVWTLDNELISCLAVSETRSEVALGLSDGSVQIWGAREWNLRATVSSSTGISKLMYGSIKNSSTIPSVFLLAQTVDGEVEMWDCDDVVSSTESKKQVSEPVKPVLQLQSVATTGGWSLSPAGLLSLESELEEIQVFDLSKVSPITASPSPDPPHVTLHTSEPPGSSCWVEPRCLATASISSPDISLWDVGTHLDSRTQSRRSALYDQRNIYTPSRTFSNEAPPLCMGAANDLFITGDGEGCIRVLDPKSGKLLQTFSDHKGRVTDLYVDRFRVLSCSVDFSIRVYRWVKTAGVRPGGTTAQLESRYTLLGGSVALRQHDGFNRLVCSASSCVGVAGNQLKFYTFTANLKEK
ncbi:hypothetical protein GBAR_LOCUS5169 [Geodia barretti]|uniref:F-box domain-containing protein n=2 Tax=Geodia barretti TaxID=519541 RepID=A0AA35R9J9_GEOBA|nr:hypothetical protein GBAR_LOCUS5169 [Geodia barretti]